MYADALALAGFTEGLDIVLLVGRLHLLKPQPVDEVHEELLERLAPLGGEDLAAGDPVPL